MGAKPEADGGGCGHKTESGGTTHNPSDGGGGPKCETSDPIRLAPAACQPQMMERWIRSAREECLDKLLNIDSPHLQRVMHDYAAFFNAVRPHQGIEQQISFKQATIFKDPCAAATCWVASFTTTIAVLRNQQQGIYMVC
ncbi:MAG: transposase [Chloroflexi bacterium]|nr:transposase [Chloroflexota bacterium]